MNNKPLISVIVPVYNMEKYLNRCVDSVLGQSYNNIELILVDDGSTDSSFDICKSYQDKNSRVTAIHKENGGQGSARNIGLDVAKGYYIGFVDSDDWIETDMYEILYNNIIEYSADISCCRHHKKDGIDIKNDNVKVFEQPDIMRMHLFHHEGFGQSPCDKLYKKKLFDGIRFPEMRAYEDCATIYQVLAKANKVVFQNVNLYHYETRENSTMTQKFSAVKFQSVTAYLGMYEFYKSKYPQYANQVKKMLMGSIQYCVGETLVLKRKREYKNEIDNVESILKKIGAKGLSFKGKVNYFLILHLKSIYKFFYKIKH